MLRWFDDLWLGLWDHYLDCCTSEKIGCHMSDAALCDPEIMLIDFDADAVPAPLRGGNRSRSRSHERIENSVTDEAEHSDEAFG
jgi:hypothetical protein